MNEAYPTNWMDWLREQRQRAINTLLVILLILGAVGIGASLWRVITGYGFTFTLPVYLATYIGIFALYIFRKVSAQVRGWAILILIYLFSVFALYSGWLSSGGRLFLMVFVLLASFLINQSVGVVAAVVSFFTYVGFALVYTEGWLKLKILPDQTSLSPILIEGVGFTIAIGAGVVMQWYTTKALMAASSANQDAQQARRLLLERNNELEKANQEIERLSETALSESELKFRSFVEQSSDGLVLTDEQGRIIEWNKAQESISGYTRDEVLGREIWDAQGLLAPDGKWTRELADSVKSMTLQVLQEGSGSFIGQPRDIKLVRKDGKTLHIQQMVFPIKTVKGYRLGSINRDITTRMESEQKLENLRRFSQDLTGLLDLPGLARLISLHCLKIFGYDSFRIDGYNESTQLRSPIYAEDTPEEGGGPLVIYTIYEKDVHLKLTKAFASRVKPPEALQRGLASEKYLQNRLATDLAGRMPPWGFPERRSSSIMYAPVHWQGHVIGLLHVSSYQIDRYQSRDLELLQMIADQCGNALRRVQAEEELRLNEQRYIALFDNTNDAVFTFSLEGRYLSVNQQAARMLGYTREEMTGMSYEQVVAPEEFMDGESKLSQLISGKILPIYERTFIRKDGTQLPVEINAVVVYDPTGKPLHIQSIARDISERKKTEMEREKLINELETRNAELERYAYTVSHDLKAPLITIQGFLGYLEKDAISGNYERLKGDINRISQAAEKMGQLLNELLELSRVGRLVNPPEAIAFSDLVQEALTMLTGKIIDCHVIVDIEPGLPVVFGDRTRLVEVLLNLLDNAIKFMGNQPEPSISIGVRGVQPDGKPILYIKDNGIGIDPQFHEKVFGLFNKLDAQSEGTGIGLTLVKRIVEVHGGKIWLESEGAGQGTTFFFSLPVVSERL